MASWVKDLTNCVSALANWDGNVATVKLTWPNGMIMWPAGWVKFASWDGDLANRNRIIATRTVTWQLGM